MVKRSALLFLLFFFLTHCADKSVRFEVQILTDTCQNDVAPLANASHLKVTVLGDKLTPVSRVSSVASKKLEVPDIAAGTNRYVEVRAYAENPDDATKILAFGRSSKFDVPNVVPRDSKPQSITIVLRRVDVFSPMTLKTNTSTCAQLHTARAAQSAAWVSKAEGLVVAKGFYFVAPTKLADLASVELINPVLGTVSELPLYEYPSAFQTVQVVRDQMLLWGGLYYGTDGTAYFPTSQRLVTPPAADGSFPASQGTVPSGGYSLIARVRHVTIRDNASRVLIAGGATWSSSMLSKFSEAVPTQTVEWYNPEKKVPAIVTQNARTRYDAMGVAVLGESEAWVLGGADDAGVRRDGVKYTFADAGFSETPLTLTLTTGRRLASSAIVSDDKHVMVAGGFSDNGESVSDTSELIDVETQSVTQGPIVAARADACSVVLEDGRVFVAGGRKPIVPSGLMADDRVELYFVENGVLKKVDGPKIPVPRYAHSCVRLNDGSVAVLGGVDDTGATAKVLGDIWVYMPKPKS